MPDKRNNTYKPLLDTRGKAIAAIVGIIAFSVLIILFFMTAERKVSLVFPDCILRTATGIKCFLCGGTRCIRSVVAGDIIKAFYYNPFVVLCGISLAVWFIRLVLSVLKKEYRPLRLSEKYLWVILIGVLVFSVLRNFDFYQTVFY